MTTIADIPQDYHLVTDSQDVREIYRHFTGTDRPNGAAIFHCGGFFVKIEDGEYISVYGFQGIIPNLNKQVWHFNPRTDVKLR